MIDLECTQVQVDKSTHLIRLNMPANRAAEVAISIINQLNALKWENTDDNISITAFCTVEEVGE